MQLPVDIKAVIDEALDIDEARHTALSVSVYLDDSAPADLQAHVRQAFASASPHARVSLTYLDGRPFAAYAGDDMACIVAGLNDHVGVYADDLRRAGVPVMVVTTLPTLVSDIAKEAGYPIPQGDLVAPRLPRVLPAEGESDASATLQGASSANTNMRVSVGKHAAPAAATHVTTTQYVAADQPGSEPFALDDQTRASLDERMGGWVIEACKEKRLSFALAFPFVRKPLSLEAVNSTALQNAGVGLLVIIPGADMPVMTLNQAKMLLMIAASYGEELNMERVKELAALVGGAFACRAVARQLVAFVPGLGWAIKAAIGYTGTLAMGRAAIEYYEGNASFSKLTDAVAAARDKVVQAAAKKAAQKAQATGARAVDAARTRVATAAQGVRGAAGTTRSAAAGGVRSAAGNLRNAAGGVRDAAASRLSRGNTTNL